MLFKYQYSGIVNMSLSYFYLPLGQGSNQGRIHLLILYISLFYYDKLETEKQRSIEEKITLFMIIIYIYIYLGVVAIEKGVFRSPWTKVTNFTYYTHTHTHIYIYIYIYIYKWTSIKL